MKQNVLYIPSSGAFRPGTERERVVMLIGFFALWIILCGNITAEILLFGAVVSLLVFWFTCRYCKWSIQREMVFWRLLPAGLHYILLLLREILLSNLAMLQITFRRDFREQCRPVLVKVHAPFRSNIAKMTLANSITLTPGTITVENLGKDFLIHCFNATYSVNMGEMDLVRQLIKMEAIVSRAKEGGF